MQGIDPISQMLGGLSAQVSALASQVIDLRSEIVTNRQVNQNRWDEFTKQVDLVQAEFRNVKHSERQLEQEKILTNDRLVKIEKRLREIEEVILTWRVRISTLLTVGVAIGTLVGFLAKIVIDAAVQHWWG